MRRAELQDAERAIYRGVAHAALVWDVDRASATHNPVFWRDGALNYLSPNSADQKVFAFLRQRRIMTEGFNHANRLNFSFEQLDEALDLDYASGIDFQSVLGLLFIQFEWWGFFSFGPQAGPHFIEHTRQHATEVRAIFSHLAALGYLTGGEQSSEPQYRWTPQAVPIVKQHLYIDLQL